MNYSFEGDPIKLTSAEKQRITQVVADGNYSHVYLSDGRRVVTCYPISRYQACLQNFVRSHRSYLVNANYIQSFSRIKASLVLHNKKVVPVSRRKIHEIGHQLRQRS